MRFSTLIQVLGATLILSSATAAAQLPGVDRVILITADGLRWQEVFRGSDPKLINREDDGMKDAGEVRERFHQGPPGERRRRLMPFLWSTIATTGVVYGNRDKGSKVNVRNRHRFSYPGYSEILVGRPQDDLIDSNDNKPNPSLTVLEIVRRELKLPREKVALFGSWVVFEGIGAHVPGSVFINAGYHRLRLQGASKRMRRLSSDQFDLLTPWRSVRHDYTTFELALEYLRTRKPRLLYIALGETDDWAHGDRYDRYLEMAHYLDHCLRTLWEQLEQDPEYRGRTAIIVATDHGRGSTPKDWSSHGEDVAGAENIWIAAIGAGIKPGGEAAGGETLTQSDIAPSIMRLMGLDPTLLGAGVGRPLPAVEQAAHKRKAR